MHLGSIYLIVDNFEKSISFYEKLLNMTVTGINKDRFAQFIFERHNIALMNGHFDTDHPDKIIHKGEITTFFDDTLHRTLAPNTQKFVLNFWDENLRTEYERIKNLTYLCFFISILLIYIIYIDLKISVIRFGRFSC